MYRNNHGSWAKIGDLVEILSPVQHSTGIFGVVVEERWVGIHGTRNLNVLCSDHDVDGKMLTWVKDCWVKIVEEE